VWLADQSSVSFNTKTALYGACVCVLPSFATISCAISVLTGCRAGPISTLQPSYTTHVAVSPPAGKSAQLNGAIACTTIDLDGLVFVSVSKRVCAPAPSCFRLCGINAAF
jgi:hypothetical protein